MVFNFLFDFLFPRRCVFCGKLGSYLCPFCLKKIEFLQTSVCPVCERPAIDGKTHPGCQTRYSLDGLISACLYDGPIKVAIKRLKYKPWISDLGEILADLLSKYLASDSSIVQTIELRPLVVPVPLHKSRERQRGFNQAEILGKLLAEKLNLEFIPDLLCRHKKTKPQVELQGKERQENIQDAFSIPPNSPNNLISPAEGEARLWRQNPNILLLDDVWTTGATLRAGGNVLKRAGAQSVWALTLAR